MDARELRQIGPYAVKRFVDEGAFAWVFEVVDPKFAGRRLALKMLKPEAAAGEEFRRFEDEASLLAQINHPHVVTIFDFGRDEATGCFFYTMTFIDGPTLKDRLAAEGCLPAEEALRIFVDILDGLDKVHRRRIVHRDIKPGNILLDDDGRAYLGDLGIARVQTERSKTRTGVAVGTALYMSPEQARGKPVDTRSDLFSVGLTLYEVLTGQVVYDHVESVDSTSGMDVLMYIGGLVHQKREFEVIFPPEPEIPKQLKEIIKKACRLNVDDRYQTAAELRAELVDYLHAPPSTGMTLPELWSRYRLPILLGAGSVVLLVAGLATWLAVESGRQQREAQVLLEETLARREDVDRIVARAGNLEPAQPLLDEVTALVRQADDEATQAEQDAVEGYHDYAIKRFTTALDTYGEVCGLLTGDFLSARADAEAENVRQRAEDLAAAGAAEHAAEPWAAWQALSSQLAAAGGEGCAAASAELARVDAAREADTVLARVEQGLQETWPRLAEEAHQQAVTARRRSEVETVDAQEYELAQREAKRLLVRGEVRQKRGDFRAAREAFEEATRTFAEALAIAPAARGRNQAHALAVDIQERGSLIGPASRTLSEADRLYSERKWPEAAAAYERALESLRGMRAEQELLAAAQEARAGAASAREGAAAEGTEASAPDAWAEAQAKLAEAEASLESGDAAAAEERFLAARDAFKQAQDVAIRAQDAAGARALEVQAARDALLGERDCEALGSEEARAFCAAGAKTHEAGQAALAERDAARAGEQLAASLESYERAAALEQAWEAARPKPPVLAQRMPERERVEGKRGELRSFRVEAHDPNGDPLRYTWTVGGELQEESGSALQLRLERNAEVAVRVDDGQGGELRESWQVEVENQPPTLAVVPQSEEVRVEPGGTQRFQAVARDADEEDVRTLFRLDGDEVAGGTTYVFEARRPGSYKLEVVATDVRGATSRVARRIVVPSAGAATVGDADWRTEVQRALDDYEQALEDGDIAQLEDVLIMGPNSPVRAFYQRKFSRGEEVAVRIDVKGEIRGNGKVATVDFDQIESTGTRTRPRVYRYRVSMVRQGDGNWRIERRERRR